MCVCVSIDFVNGISDSIVPYHCRLPRSHLHIVSLCISLSLSVILVLVAPSSYPLPLHILDGNEMCPCQRVYTDGV